MGALLVVTGLMFVFGAQNMFGQWLLETFPTLGRIEDLATPDNLGGEILKKSAP